MKSRIYSVLVVSWIAISGIDMEARIVIRDDVKEEIDGLYAAATCPGGEQEAIRKIKAKVEEHELPREKRAYALERLADLALEKQRFDLIGYFREAHLNAEGLDRFAGLGPAASIQWWRLREARLPSTEERNALLLDALKDGDSDALQNYERSWMIKELCGRGVADVLEIAWEQFVESSSDGFRWRYDLCETQTQLLSEHSTREEALAAALQLPVRELHEKIFTWAIDSLGALTSQLATEILLDVGVGKKPYSRIPASRREHALVQLNLRGFSYQELKSRGATGMSLYRAGISSRDTETTGGSSPCGDSEEGEE